MSELADKDKKEVAVLIRRIYDSLLRFDPGTLESCDLEDCTIWDLFEPDLVRGGPLARAEFRERDITHSKQRGPLSIELGEPIIDGWDDFAVARYYLRYEFRPPGALSGHVRVTTVARRVDGEWRRVHHHEGDVPAGRPPVD